MPSPSILSTAHWLLWAQTDASASGTKTPAPSWRPQSSSTSPLPLAASTTMATSSHTPPATTGQRFEPLRTRTKVVFISLYAPFRVKFFFYLRSFRATSTTTPRKRTTSFWGTPLRSWSLGTRNGERRAAAVCYRGNRGQWMGLPHSPIAPVALTIGSQRHARMWAVRIPMWFWIQSCSVAILRGNSTMHFKCVFLNKIVCTSNFCTLTSMIVKAGAHCLASKQSHDTWRSFLFWILTRFEEQQCLYYSNQHILDAFLPVEK